MDTIGQRIMHIRKEIAKLNQTEFGKLLGVVHVTISQIELGKSKPTPEQLITIKKNFNVSTDWILTGEGDKFGNPDTAALIAELDVLKRKYQKSQALLAEYMAEEAVPVVAKLGKVKGIRQPIGTPKPAAIMNVVGGVTKTDTKAREATRRA